ncbi:uncharacterized protein LOC107221305 [Neodiprion lecontei]|uniref:Uncharacterized protein LOC107221305 n=1 Tax=Neodiprion lecontei TaxID=441921 RepID=A0ABM3GNY9_NEOLC|nr:uncharacterized protein LOC107221305 [Neodiprion lecontei]
MGFVSANLLLQLLGIIITIVGAIYLYLKHVAYHYWNAKGIPQAEPVIPFGNLWPVLTAKKSIGQLMGELYLDFRKNRIFGVYSFYKPTLVVCDPEIIKFMMTKEFTAFQDRGMFHNEKIDPMSGHLFLLGGPKWKRLRAKFTPTFTTGKIKQMFPTVKEIAENLDKRMRKEANQSSVVEVKDLVARFSTDVIASVAFGIDCNSLENPDAEFRAWGRKFLEPQPVKNVMMALCPSVMMMLHFKTVDDGTSKFIINTFNDTVKYRTENNVVRKDFLDLVIQLMTKGYVKSDDGKDTERDPVAASEKITMLEGAAQAFVFWLGGFETSSSTATHCLYEMAMNPDIQEKLSREINIVLEKVGGLTYDAIAEMPYLDKVVSETLRKYPSFPILNRECNREVELPETGFVVPTGTPIVFPVMGIHWNPDIYPDPEKFDPERFSEENIAKRHRYAYLPFGEGPRNCIGMRFGLFQTKISLITLLSKYRFKPAPETKVPLPVDTGNFLLMSVGGVPLRVEERNVYNTMGLISANLFLQFLGVIISIAGAIYLYLKHVAYHYWTSKGIAQSEPVVPFGTIWPVLTAKLSVGQLMRDLYLKFRKNRIFGVYSFHIPNLVVCDPEIIRFIMTKEFTAFQDRGMYHNEQLDPMTGNLFLLGGPKWRHLRVKFTPTFTTGKIKYMFTTVKDIADNLSKRIATETSQSDLVEVKDLMARFSTDVIASVAFGIECNSLENPKAEFRSWGRKLLEPNPLKNTMMALCPSIMQLFKIKFLDEGASNFIINAFKDTVEYRTANNVVRKDFMELVIQLLTKGYVNPDDEKDAQPDAMPSTDKITMLEGAAQAFVFWVGGFETSSSTATHCLYEMAMNPDIQDKLAEEMNMVLEKFGGLSYDAIMEMTYLHKVVSETLRKYPSLPVLNRECNREIELPGTGFVVPVGTPILFPILGIHWNPEYYPEPEKFDPERFSEENIAKRHRYAYLPFGEGPRNCIGMRFGLLQTKIGLITLLSKYRLKPGPDTKSPLVMDTGNFLQMPLGGMKLRVEERC